MHACCTPLYSHDYGMIMVWNTSTFLIVINIAICVYFIVYLFSLGGVTAAEYSRCFSEESVATVAAVQPQSSYGNCLIVKVLLQPFQGRKTQKVFLSVKYYYEYDYTCLKCI